MLRPAGICVLSGCDADEMYEALRAVGSEIRQTTCPDQLPEGGTCTIKCGGTKDNGEPDGVTVLGHFTCLRAKLYGAPTCVDAEAKSWMVAWVLPKILGAFDFKGALTRSVNMSNGTIAAFRTNVSKSLSDILLNVDPSHFEILEVSHLWESMAVDDADTGLPVTWEREHLFSVNYELIIWDINVLRYNFNALQAILRPSSSTFRTFEDLIHMRANMTISELFPTKYPITFNATYLAPDTQLSGAARLSGWRQLRLLLVLLAVASLTHVLSGLLSDG